MLPQPSEKKQTTLEDFTEEMMRFRNPDLFTIFRCGCGNNYCVGWRIVGKTDLDLEPRRLTLPVDVEGPLEGPDY